MLDKKNLYNDILNNYFHGNIDKMYKVFETFTEHLSVYGNTKEQALENYCSFQSEIVLVRFAFYEKEHAIG